MQENRDGGPARNPGRSTLAIGTGFIAVVDLAIGTDVLTYRLGIFTSVKEAHWYPIAIALTALPCAWVGGLRRRPA